MSSHFCRTRSSSNRQNRLRQCRVVLYSCSLFASKFSEVFRVRAAHISAPKEIHNTIRSFENIFFIAHQPPYNLIGSSPLLSRSARCCSANSSNKGARNSYLMLLRYSTKAYRLTCCSCELNYRLRFVDCTTLLLLEMP